MNLKSRIKKLEQSEGLDKDLCRCLDALSLVGTPFQEFFYRCEREINIKTWKNWQTFQPITEETNFFAMGLKRDDDGVLSAKPKHYFLNEACELMEAYAGESIVRKFVQTREEFEHWQKKHVLSGHISYEEYLTGQDFNVDYSGENQ